MDIQRLIEQAREQKLASDAVMPMLLAELSDTSVQILALAILDDTQMIIDQEAMIARQGWELSQKHPGVDLLAAGFFGEIWIPYTTQEESEQPQTFTFVQTDEQALGALKTELTFSRRTKKREAIVVGTWHKDAAPETTYLFPTRNRKQQLLAVPEPKRIIPSLTKYLEFFVMGWEDGQKPYEEVIARYDLQIAERMKLLDPNAQRLLRLFLKERGIHIPGID